MSGDASLAVKFADDTHVALPSNAYGAARALIAYGRYAPEKALATRQPADDYGKAMWRYARGEAFAAEGNAAALRQEAVALAAFLDPRPRLNEFEFNQADLARQVLEGRAAMMDGRTAEAVAIFRAAAAAQDKFGWGSDPPPWWYPIRRSLAAAELKLGKPADAAKDAEASLKAWPQDGLALQILAAAETAQGKAADAQKSETERQKWWKGKPLALELI